jgi:hypothetical protein
VGVAARTPRGQVAAPQLIVEVSWRPNPGISVDVQSGVAFARSLELRDGDDTVSEEDLDSVPYVRVGLRLF